MTLIAIWNGRTGITCGPLIAADDRNLTWDGHVEEGDSGAAVFTVNHTGDALGVGIAALLVRAVDLAALTGGATAAALVVDPATVGAVVGGLLAVAGATIAVSSALAGRADAAQQLRIGEDR